MYKKIQCIILNLYSVHYYSWIFTRIRKNFLSDRYLATKGKVFDRTQAPQPTKRDENRSGFDYHGVRGRICSSVF